MRMYAYVPDLFSGVMSCRFSHSLRRSDGAAVRWCGDPVVRRSGGLMMFSYTLHGSFLDISIAQLFRAVMR